MSEHRKAEGNPATVGAALALATLVGMAYLQRQYVAAPAGIVQAGTVGASEPTILKHASTSLHSPATPRVVRGRQSLRLEDAPQATGQIAGEVANEIPEAFVGSRQAKETLLKVNDGVYWEDVIRTLGTGRVRLQLRDGSRLNIGARSRMTIVKHDPQSQQTEIELKLGQIRGEVMKLTKSGGRFEVKTPTTVLGVVGTILLVDAHDSFTQVCAVEGSVRVRNVNPAVPGERILHAGECARIEQGQAPGDVVNPGALISVLTNLTDVPDLAAGLVNSSNSILVEASEVAGLISATWGTGSTGNGYWTTASEWSCDTWPPNCVPNNNINNVFSAVLDYSGNTLTLGNITGSPLNITINTLSLQAGTLVIGSGVTLNLVNQPSGITDIPLNAGLTVAGTFEVNGGPTSALAQLRSVEGALTLEGQTLTVTPGGGTLTNSGTISLIDTTALTVKGNLSNSKNIFLGNGADTGRNALTVTGTLTNSGNTILSDANDSVSVTGATSNTGNIYLNGNHETLTASGGLTNNDGTVVANGNNDTITVTGSFNNTQSTVKLLGIGNTVEVTGNLDNNNSTVMLGTGNAIHVTGNLDKKAALGTGNTIQVSGNFDNNNSTVVLGMGNTIQVSGNFDNNNGTLVAAGTGGTSLLAAIAFINGGTVSLSGGGDTLSAPSFTNTGNVSIGVDETVTAGATGTYTQTTGSTTVNGTLTAGAVSLQSGSLLGAGTIHGSVNNSGGSVEAASATGVPGTLTVTGNYTQGPNGTLIVDLGPNFPAHSFFDVFVDVTLGGTVDFNAVGGFTPATGEDFTFLQWGGNKSGNFTKMELTGWSCPEGDTCTDVFGANSLTLEITRSTKTPTPEPSSLILLGTAMAIALALGLGTVVNAR